MSSIQSLKQAPPLTRSPVAPGQRAAHPGAMAGMTGRDIIRILLKRKWLILISFSSFLAITIVGTVLWKTYAPSYTADAIIELFPNRSAVLQGTEASAAPEVMERMTMQFSQLIKRQNILEEALADQEVKNTGWFAAARLEDPVKQLGDDLDIAPIPKTNLIRLSMTSQRLEDIAPIVNAVTKAAVEDSRVNKQLTRQVDLEKLDQKIAELQARKDKRSKEVADLLTGSSSSGLESRKSSLQIRLASLLPMQQKLRMEQAEAQKKLDLLTEQLKDPARVMEIEEVGKMMAGDQSLNALRNAHMNYQAQLDDLMSRGFGKNHRSVQKLEGMLQSIQKQEEDAAKDAAQKGMGMARGARMADVAKATDSLGQLLEEQNLIEAETREVAGQLSKLDEANKEIINLDKQIEPLQKAQSEWQMQMRMSTTAQVRSWAKKPNPGLPSQPQWKIMMPVGLLLGLVVGLGLAFLLEFIDTSIKSPSDITRRLDLPMLGMIPHEDDTVEDIQDLRMAVLNHPASLFSESFRQIRTCLMFSGPADQRRSLLVTSAQPEDGRTVVAVNLGTTIAASGQRVLIVDANFRQPMLRKLFPQIPVGGLSSAMTGQAAWRDMVAQVGENLYIMSSGPLPPNPAELLHSDAMRKIIAEMSAEYDQVIFDGAPALVVTDSPVLSTMVDGVILVVRAGVNTHGIVHRARDTFARVGAHMIGIVLNGVRITAGGYLRKNYETFYEYQSAAKLPPT